MDKDLVNLVAKQLGENPAIIIKSIDHYEEFITKIIKGGTLENVRIPQFGTFIVNMKKLKYLIDSRTMPKSKVIKRQKKTS